MSSAAFAKQAEFKHHSKSLHIALWVAQILLHDHVLHGRLHEGFHAARPDRQDHAVVPAVPAVLVRFIGVAELLGALGLIFPSATRIQPKLTPLAALGLAIVVLLGAGLHFTRGEGALTPLNFVLAALAAFVIWGRLKKEPIQPRS